MKKLTTLFAAATLSVAASQASALVTTVMDFDLAPGFACQYTLGCDPAGSHMTVQVDWNDNDNDGIGTLADYVELRMFVDGVIFGGPIGMSPFVENFSIDISDSNGSTVTDFDWWWTATGVSPSFTYQSSTGDVHYAQGCADAIGGCSSPFDTSALNSGPVTFSGYVDAPSAAPVPAAAWLFGSALLGLVGIGRKRA